MGPARALHRRRGATWPLAEQRRTTHFAYEFVRFGIKQAWACLFGAAMVALITATYLWYPHHAWLARYDFIFLAAIAIQAGMLGFRLETLEEAKVILIFHIVGTVMEVFKTGVGSWIYPEPCFFRIAGVPLFSGFHVREHRQLHRPRLAPVRFPICAPPANVERVRPRRCDLPEFLCASFMLDQRYLLFAASLLLLGRTRIYFRNWRAYRWMPLLLACFLNAFFIWIAENVGTFTKTWLYPQQMAGWTTVSVGKLGSWFLLLMISYALVAAVNKPQDIAEAPKLHG